MADKNTLTLPITAGKKYIRRDGEVVTVTQIEQQFRTMFNSAHYEGDACWASSGRSSGAAENPTDLVADYVETQGHIHAASMAEFAQDALETDRPWELWECRVSNCGDMWNTCSNLPLWLPENEYRRKRKTIRIGEFEVPEPMREAPPVGALYFAIYGLSYGSIQELPWRNDFYDRRVLKNGLAHLTREAAELHAQALLSFTKVQP